MNKTAAAVLLAFVGVGLGLLVMPRGDYRMAGAHRRPEPAASGGAHRAAAPGTVDANADTAVAADAAASAELARAPVPENGEAADGVAAPDGSGAALDLGKAPKSMVIGVVLIQFAGAQGAAPGTRSKADALKLAEELAVAAREDFAAAVKRGDAGSTVDAGKMFRGILEPSVEYAVFSLEKEAVSEPVETPRGFWIVRRVK